MKMRVESSGGLLWFSRARVLLSVNRAAMRWLGVNAHAKWAGSETATLSAPLEVQFLGTAACAHGCTSCSVAATPRGPSLTLAQSTAAIDALVAANVFTIAFGGGEALDWPSLFEAAEYAVDRGLEVTLTTSGISLTEQNAAQCSVFSSVNVSFDGVGERFRVARGYDGSSAALNAALLLKKHVSNVGLNAVVMRSSFDGLDEIFRIARKNRFGLQLLRFKPVGRGAASSQSLTPEQSRAFFPKVRRLALKHGVRVRLDCALGPLVFWHRPPLWQVRFFGIQGCASGRELAAVLPSGILRGCAFVGAPQAQATDATAVASAFADGFQNERTWVQRAPSPCRECVYLNECRGGCRAVAGADAPDPGCPTVMEWQSQRSLT